MQSFPLVSVVVIAYNSAEYITDTLDSIKSQTYPQLELVINDDKSQDNTVELCKKWILVNGGRFKKIRISEPEKNLGISGSAINGINAASGIWIKFVAGDDLLLPDCITDMLQFAVVNKYECVIADMKTTKNKIISDYTLHQKKRNRFFKLTTKKKYQSYTNYPFFLSAPTGFYKKNLLDRTNPFDVKYRMVEDQQLFLTILKNGADIGYLKKATVIYRLHTASMTGKFNIRLYRELYNCFLEFRKPYIGNTLTGNLLKRIWENYYKNIGIYVVELAMSTYDCKGLK